MNVDNSLAHVPQQKPNHEVNSLVPNWILSSNFPYWTTFASRVIGQYWVGSDSLQAIGSGLVPCIASVRVFLWYGSGRVSPFGSGRVVIPHSVRVPALVPRLVPFLILIRSDSFTILRSEPFVLKPILLRSSDQLPRSSHVPIRSLLLYPIRSQFN